MDERRQPDSGTNHAETPAWRVNGAHGPAGARNDHGWSSAGAALEPSPEPLALLTSGPDGAGGNARHRQPYVPGLDDDTPASGTPVAEPPAAEPPLWREAARHSVRAPAGYGEYGSTPVADLLRPGTGDRDREPPPWQPDRPAGAAEPDRPDYPDHPDHPERRDRPDRPGPADRTGEPPEPGGLPQRVPAEPDVPEVQEPGPAAGGSPSDLAAGRDRWTAPELAFIADQLRRDDVPREALTGTFDVDAVVAAVREVPGVEEASVRTNPTGMHTLRLDLADDADPGQVSRTVARLLLERMGLSASPQDVPQADPARPPVDPGAGLPAYPARPPVDPGGSPEPEAATASPGPGAPPGPGATIPAQPHRAADGWWYEPVGDQLVPEPEDEPIPEPVSRPLPNRQPGPRVVIDQVQVRTFGLEATVEVLLTAGDRQATGVAQGPAVDSYLVRLAAVAAARAIDSLLRPVADPSGPSRCFVEHTGLVEFGNTQVAVVVLLLVCGGWVEQLTGSALVDGDPRQAVVRATLGAVNRRLEALLD